MRFYRLFTRLVLIGLLLPVCTAWGGAAELGFAICRRQVNLIHICQGGEHAGQQCPESRQCQGTTGQTNPCPDDCVVKFVPESVTTLPLTVPGTLTFVLDEPEEQPLLTMFLEVKESDGVPRLFSITNPGGFGETFFPSVTFSEVGHRLLFRQAPANLATSLYQMFKTSLCVGIYGNSECQLPNNVIPIIADIREPIYRRPIGSFFGDNRQRVLGAPVDIGFAFLRQVATSSIPGDLDKDNDVDQSDVNLLLLDRDRGVSQSNCGVACDLDADGKITALDARKVTLLCTRPRCATQ